MDVLSYGQIVFYTGIVFIGGSITAFIVGMVVFSAKRKNLKKQLMDKYGF